MLGMQVCSIILPSMHHNSQPLLIGFLSSKLPPPPCAVLAGGKHKTRNKLYFLMCGPIYLSIYLSICLSVCLSVCLPAYLPVYLPICLEMHQKDGWPACPPPPLAGAGWPAVDAISWVSAPAPSEPWPPLASKLVEKSPSTKLALGSACKFIAAFWLNRSSSSWVVLVSTQNFIQDSISGQSSSGTPPLWQRWP